MDLIFGYKVISTHSVIDNLQLSNREYKKKWEDAIKMYKIIGYTINE